MITDAERLGRLSPPTGKVRMVLDTDTYNEVDDQFALAYALLSPEAMDVEAVYAAPFHNERSTGPGDGMEKSREEILRVLDRMDVPHPPVHRGSTAYLTGREEPEHSAAVEDLISRALEPHETPLYVTAIGAITNIASALKIEPRIAEHVIVVWLGGQPFSAGSAREFNLQQDPEASQLVFDCGVPLVHVPCQGVASHLLTTVAELEQNVAGQGAIGDHLYTMVKDYRAHDVTLARPYEAREAGWSKVIWDLSAIAYLVNPAWVPTDIVHSPLLTDRLTWSFDRSRHLVRTATMVYRDAVYGDFFTKLAAHAERAG